MGSNRLAFLGGIGVGSTAACMLAYFADPRLGRRRRALAGAKLAHATRSGRQGVGKASRGLANHTRGLWARIAARIRTESPADEVVEQRVRAALGRLSRHVSAISVSVQGGALTLTGPILEREHRRVVRAAGRIRGVRSVQDQLERHLHSDVQGLRGGSTPGKAGSQRRCAEFMKADPQSVMETDSLRQAAELMATANIGFLPVCDADRRVIGTITDRDIVVRGVALGADLENGMVSDVMSRNVIACRPDDELGIVEQFMSYYQVSRMVITDERDVLLGVISLSDIAEREPARRAARTLRAVAAREAPRISH
ncbi:MAG TPA: CBS domain-containing protein [Polyangia bacterium]|jgi:CBS domain-containing protein|nr:CBS domain-containing protein [Polyangia bacterium]